MAAHTTHVDMLRLIAQALGPGLCKQVTFVGGCTTSLLLTDAFTREQVRYTEDVDLIVHVISKMAFADFQRQLRARNFKDPAMDSAETTPICAMFLNDLRVDFMPDDERILGFGNRWYRQAMATATPFNLDDTLTINIVHPVYFIALNWKPTKGAAGMIHSPARI